MAILPIRIYPDPVLRKKSITVEKFDSKLKSFLEDLRETMYALPGGIGIAAPQVGNLIRIICMDVTPKEQAHGRLFLINPVITKQVGERIAREGCMSIPEYTANVRRSAEITVEALNEKGEELCVTLSGIEAVCIQHELDHLDGVLFLDRVDSVKTDVFRRKRFKDL